MNDVLMRTLMEVTNTPECDIEKNDVRQGYAQRNEIYIFSPFFQVFAIIDQSHITKLFLVFVKTQNKGILYNGPNNWNFHANKPYFNEAYATLSRCIQRIVIVYRYEKKSYQ